MCVCMCACVCVCMCVCRHWNVSKLLEDGCMYVYICVCVCAGTRKDVNKLLDVINKSDLPAKYHLPLDVWYRRVCAYVCVHWQETRRVTQANMCCVVCTYIRF